MGSASGAASAPFTLRKRDAGPVLMASDFAARL
jgi:hypothetical protein